MSIKKLLRIGGVAVAMVIVLPLLALPAHAAPLPGTASIAAAERDVLAGATDTVFHVSVTNPGSNGTGPVGVTGEPVNEVAIAPPFGSYTIVAASAPGWTATIDSATQTVIYENNTIARGGTTVFTVETDITRPTVDQARNWRVSVSSNGGDTSQSDSAATTGALTTTIHVLRVVSVEPTAPSAALDYAVTQNMPFVLRERVQNAGTGSPSVTASLSGSGLQACSASEASALGLSSATPAAKTIPATSEGFFDFCAKLTSAGNITVTGHSSATGDADFYTANSLPIKAQTPFDFTYVNNSLTPTTVNPLRGGVGFQLNVNKTGEVAVPSGASATLSFGDGTTTVNTSATGLSFGANNDSKLIQFTSVSIPAALPDQCYTPTITITGQDENAFGFNVSRSTNQICLDRLIPTVVPTLDAPNAQVTGAQKAVKNGDTLTFGGQAKDGSPAVNCGAPNCTVATAADPSAPAGTTGAPFLRQYDASNNAAGDISGINVTISSTGALGGTYTGNYAPGVTKVQLFVDIVDKAGNHSGYQPSNFIDVDNVLPRLGLAVTGGRPSGGSPPNDKRRIDVCWTEAVANSPAVPTTAADWKVDNHTVTAATPDGTPAGYQCVQLTLGEDLNEDETPGVTYNPAVAKPHDRVAQNAVLPAFITALDGILPPLPTITGVDAFGKQGDGFYTNNQSPVFHIGNLAVNHVVTVYRDVNGNGTLEPATDEQLGQTKAAGSTADVTSKALGTLDQSFQFLVVVNDAAGNVGPIAKDQLNLDFTPPAVLSAAASGSAVTVTFTEPLGRGRDKTQDWRAQGPDGNGNTDTYLIASVTGSGATRTATTTDPPATTLTKIFYSYLGGTAPGRYQDRAGNDLPNFNQAISG